MTFMPSPPSEPWAIHVMTNAWPAARGAVFLAVAAQRIGSAMFIEWSDAALTWPTGGDHPFIPEAEHVFTAKGIDQRLYDLYAPMVRKIMPVGVFQHRELLKAPMAEWLANVVPDPDGGEPTTRAGLRHRRGEDADDPITERHWNSAWWQGTIHADELDGARRYLFPVAAMILAGAQSGALNTMARPFYGGAAIQLPADTWEIDSAMVRLAWCGLDPERPFDLNAAPTHWLFVERESLDAFVAGIEQGSLLPELQPRPRALLDVAEAQQLEKTNVAHFPSKAAALGEVTAWLIERFDDQATERMVKDQFKEEALQRWRGRLSARGFATAWGNAVVSRPDRAKPGRRP
ncbi:MAG: hypothetical protein PGN23_15500 [Sphingomonas adhaesiva]|uniref:hypothetical protein n=1 Tax=Sphingomonas adhaesiva TaxID=28212 RepID=UPI002FF5F78F